MSKKFKATATTLMALYTTGLVLYILAPMGQPEWWPFPTPTYVGTLLGIGAFTGAMFSHMLDRTKDLEANRDELAETVRRLIPSTVIAQHVQAMVSLGLPEDKENLQPDDVQLFVGFGDSYRRIALSRVHVHSAGWLSNGNLLLETGEGVVVYAPSRYITLRGERLVLCDPDNFVPQGDTDEITLERK